MPEKCQGGVHHVWACDHYKTTLNADAAITALDDDEAWRQVRDVRNALTFLETLPEVDAARQSLINAVRDQVAVGEEMDEEIESKISKK